MRQPSATACSRSRRAPRGGRQRGVLAVLLQLWLVLVLPVAHGWELEGGHRAEAAAAHVAGAGAVDRQTVTAAEAPHDVATCALCAVLVAPALLAAAVALDVPAPGRVEAPVHALRAPPHAAAPRAAARAPPVVRS